MSHRTFGRGFLADKLYEAEDAVPADTFEQIQRRRKRRRPLGWLLPSFALLALLGLGGYLYQRNVRGGIETPTLASPPPKKSSLKASPAEHTPTLAHTSASASLGKETPSSVPSPASGTAPDGGSAAAKLARTLKGAPVKTSEAISEAEASTVRRRRSFRKSPETLAWASSRQRVSLRSSGSSVSSAPYSKQPKPRPGGEDAERSFVQASAPSGLEATAYEISLFESAQRLESRFSPLSIKPSEPSLLAVHPVGVNKNLFSRLMLTEVLIDFGPTALTQKTSFTERNFNPEKGKFSTLYTEPGIGLEAGITVRSQLSSWLGLLAGARSRVFWQTVSGKVKTSQPSPVTYYGIDAFTIEAQPQLIEQGYTLKSTIWMPIVPELLLEVRPPNAIWGIAAGGYLNAYPQTFLSYRGQGVPASPYRPSATLEPVVQLWTQTSRTRITLSVRRIQGAGLLPHPVTSTSDGLLTSATMSYRFGW